GWGSETGGFDAVIGNPPWDRIKLQEVEWFAERRVEIAKAARASDRKRMIAALAAQNNPLWQDYVEARDTAENAARVFRECGDYPLMSAGDINIYSLFVERAAALIHNRGVVGWLTPSGIAADLGAAKFFRALTSEGQGGARLISLYDFENKKVFFPDIDSRLKFCTLVFGGEARRATRTRCAFYLHAVSEINDANKALELVAADFAAVNPNTGAAPIFRSKRDAEITTAIYRRQPVLVDRRSEPPKKLWPARYVRMFDMTNDAGLFLRRDELEAQGWYAVGLNRWKKGEAEAVPLYVGRMIHQYDHRSANVTVNVESLHNPAFSDELTPEEKADANRYPVPQYWVAESDVPEQERRTWTLAFRDIARATDVRTMIATVIPTVAAGNTLPLMLGDENSVDAYT
ncbi:MAG: Eco57I restriction-modification methylase domain-containing protein, partial [Gammaproteobacteria bacterium]